MTKDLYGFMSKDGRFVSAVGDSPEDLMDVIENMGLSSKTVFKMMFEGWRVVKVGISVVEDDDLEAGLVDPA